MNHNCDVIDKRITEGTQNRFSESHSKPISEMPNFMICLIFLRDNEVHSCILFHRTLSEGQEINRRSKTLSGSHLEDNNRNFSLLLSYRSILSD